jgi:hypothetical protein
LLLKNPHLVGGNNFQIDGSIDGDKIDYNLGSAALLGVRTNAIKLVKKY